MKSNNVIQIEELIKNAKQEKKAKQLKERQKQTCEYCSKKFAKVDSLLTHKCEIRDRHTAQNEKYAVIAFTAYSKLYQHVRKGKLPTRDEFIKSLFYNAFTQFGLYVLNHKILNPQSYIEFLINNNIQPDYWCRTSLYEEHYLPQYIRNEDIAAAVQRTLLNLQSYADEHGNTINDVLKTFPSTLTVLWTRSGRLSPWFLYLCDTGNNLLLNLNEEQLKFIDTMIDIKQWKIRMLRYKDEVNEMRNILKENGL